MQVPGVSDRFGMLLELYLESCGYHRQLLYQQVQVNDCFEQVRPLRPPSTWQRYRQRLIDMGPSLRVSWPACRRSPATRNA